MLIPVRRQRLQPAIFFSSRHSPRKKENHENGPENLTAQSAQAVSQNFLPMTLHDFAQMTIRVIRKRGIDNYLPTIILPEERHIRAIRGIPDHVDHREAVQRVIRESHYQMREFFFGVQSAPHQITVCHFRPDRPTEFMEIIDTPDGYSAREIASCKWWRVS